MNIFLRVVSAILIGTGIVWVLQGTNVLPGSFMSGRNEWTRNGFITAVIGVLLLLWTIQRRHKTRG